MYAGPPPPIVLDQRWLWQVLIFLLGVTLVLRVVGLDIAGALLSGLMLWFAVVMTRDGMQEVAKYALVYGVLCSLNFFFDVLPLIPELGGRVTRTTEPVSVVKDGDIRQTTYTLTTKITPFFDQSQGFVYNVQSVTMIISPITMALGVYLAITAHNEIARHLQPFDEDFDNWDNELERAFTDRGQPTTQGGASRTTAQPQQPNMAASHRETYERFQGAPHKL